MDPELVELLTLLGDANTPPMYPGQSIGRRRSKIDPDAGTPSGVDPNKWRKLPGRAPGDLGLPGYPQPRPTQVGPISLEEAVMASVANDTGPRLFDPSAPGIPAPATWEPSDSARFNTFGPSYDPGRVHAQDFAARLGLPPSAQAALGPFNPDEEMLLAMFPEASPEEIAYIKASTSAGLRGAPDSPAGGDPRMAAAIAEADAAEEARLARQAGARGKSGTTLSTDIEQPNRLGLAEGDLDVAGRPVGAGAVGSMRDVKSPAHYLAAIGAAPQPPGLLRRAGSAAAGVGRAAARNPMKVAGGFGGLQLLASIINDPDAWAEAGSSLMDNPGEFATDLGRGFVGGLQGMGGEIAGIGGDLSRGRLDTDRLLALLGDVTGINPLAQAGNKVLGAIGL